MKEKQSKLQRLKNYFEEKWEIRGWFQIFIILLVFALTGSLSIKVSKPVIEFFGIKKELMHPAVFWPLRIIIVFPVYQLLLITIGTLLGQFKFFWKMEKKMFGRFIPNKSKIETSRSK